ncbi:MAG: Hsp20/alpha crystallin family protein [Candidatus Bathyarchaeia archaeon]
MVDYHKDDEVFRNIDNFYKRLMERMFKEMQNFERAVKSGQLKGYWDIKPIKKPGVRGYVARGQFQLGEPIHFPKRIFEEKREPLTDIFEDKESIRIYMEVPGVDKSEIQLNITDRFVEVNARNFFKTVELPTENIDHEKATASYKNGVLEVTIPKAQRTVENDKKRTIKIE